MDWLGLIGPREYSGIACEKLPVTWTSQHWFSEFFVLALKPSTHVSLPLGCNLGDSTVTSCSNLKHEPERLMDTRSPK
ncbi:hypothetical protein TIFTF001_026867 [Ficus carica]|uniref:Uncharacterized protein n=1 Tax=Ficus carica TaxID=3494 RepID=A0AA88DMZ2_FICCA|nr:hypothetical protein TIFTF001_026867 [Ficus carica]